MQHSWKLSRRTHKLVCCLKLSYEADIFIEENPDIVITVCKAKGIRFSPSSSSQLGLGIKSKRKFDKEIEWPSSCLTYISSVKIIQRTPKVAIIESILDPSYICEGFNPETFSTPFSVPILCETIAVRCKSCKTILIGGEKPCFEAVKSLPNQFWEELVDCWSCHKNEFDHVARVKLTPSKKEEALVGNDYFLVHSDCLLNSHIEDDKVLCGCGNNFATKGLDLAIAVKKYYVELQTGEGMKSCDLQSLICSMLFVHSNSHASYNFILKDSSMKCIQLSIVSFDTLLNDSNYAIEVLYKIVEKSCVDLSLMESISLESDQLAEIENILESSWLDDSFVLNNYKLGFLRWHSE